MCRGVVWYGMVLCGCGLFGLVWFGLVKLVLSLAQLQSQLVVRVLPFCHLVDALYFFVPVDDV